MVRRIAGYVLDVLGALGVATSLVAFGWPLLWPVNVPAEFVLAIAVAAAYFVLLRLSRPPARSGQKSLEVASQEFADYYANFYRREGQLHVFCKDTEWLEHVNMAPVVEALTAKGQRATLCLQILGEPVTNRLAEAGVNIVHVPEALALEIKMSLRENGTEKELIIRGAGHGTERAPRSNHKEAREINTFTESTNADMVNLALTIFRTIETS